MLRITRRRESPESRVPDYPIGGKRLLTPDNYYPALNRDNVEL
jgi:hypothetical protein